MLSAFPTLNKSRIKRFFLVILTLTAFAFAPLEEVQATTGRGSARIVLPKLNLLDIMEINAGRMGQRKGCLDPVKNYAQKLEVEHTAHRAQVLDLAQERKLPVSPARVTQAEYQNIRELLAEQKRLQSYRTCQFDLAFARAMVRAHAFAIMVVKASMTSENDAELRAFLQTTLAELVEHYEEAKALVKDLQDQQDSDDQNGGDQDDGDQDQNS
ncbi:MAG: DUF4142 domain-containing protein [Bdellovibrionales bacterium]